MKIELLAFGKTTKVMVTPPPLLLSGPFQFLQFFYSMEKRYNMEEKNA